MTPDPRHLANDVEQGAPGDGIVLGLLDGSRSTHERQAQRSPQPGHPEPATEQGAASSSMVASSAGWVMVNDHVVNIRQLPASAHQIERE